MGDGLKLSKDKRHRSSSSLAGVIEGTRSERKLDIRASIPEVDDQFAVAEARCDDLQEKIDLVKVLKRKKKLKRRSMTKVAETPPQGESIPFISVRTQPKKKMSQQAVRMRRLEVPPNPTRGYLDPATVEQHRMIGQVRGYNQAYQPQERNKQKYSSFIEPHSSPRFRMRRTRADGDAMATLDQRPPEPVASSGPLEVACGDDNTLEDFSDNDIFEDRQTSNSPKIISTPAARRRHVPRDVPSKEVPKKTNQDDAVQPRGSFNRRRPVRKAPPNMEENAAEERPVLELFSKATSKLYHQPTITNPHSVSPDKITRTKNQEVFTHKLEDENTGPLREAPSEGTKKDPHPHRHRRCVKYRSRRYEQPTVASQMKQAGARYCYDPGHTSNIPFVVSKSTAPSHNIGVNIQQVLNGIKIQQPLSGIPSTIAHHMGLGHVPMFGTTKSAVTQPSLDISEMNVIRLGKRLVRLPSYRYMSYRRLLALYREGDGMVPRFLRAISRPHYFYTSMYNLATNREDADGATSKGRGSQEAKQSLAEYAGLYREYEHVEKCLKNEYQPELERRKEELSRELAMREEHIRRVVQEYRSDMNQNNLRASASTADDTYRHSSFKLHSEDLRQ